MTLPNSSTIHCIYNLLCIWENPDCSHWTPGLAVVLDEMSGTLSGTELLMLYATLFWTLLFLAFFPGLVIPVVQCA